MTSKMADEKNDGMKLSFSTKRGVRSALAMPPSAFNLYCWLAIPGEAERRTVIYTVSFAWHGLVSGIMDIPDMK